MDELEHLEELIKRENWKFVEEGGVTKILAYGRTFPLVHPLAIYQKLYREEKNPEMKFVYMKWIHDALWPNEVLTWNYWTERRFRTYCEGWRIISWAAGASTGKSVDASKIAIIEYTSNPKNTAVIVASTTLESLNSRVFGYLVGYLRHTAIKIPYKLLRSQPPKILYDRDDSIHTISAIAAAKGKDEDAIKNYIGRHPKQKLFIILDEAPDLDLSILSAIPNLEAGQNAFQVIAIGNSNSKNDLHGSLSVPENGWESVDPLKNTQWRTTQKNGLCLFFSCYESPAIFEKDPVRKVALSKFLPTEEQINAKKIEYGNDSDAFWRFVLGFWRLENASDVIVSSAFLRGLNVEKNAEWSGLHGLSMVAGLDPAFSVGGDQCVLRLAMLGQDISGNIVLDFRGEKLLFRLHLSAVIQKSLEEQIAEQVIKILNDFNCPLQNLCVDANGAGFALAEVIKLKAQAIRAPLKVYTVKAGTKSKRFDIIARTPYEMWYAVREFIHHGQIRGLDQKAIVQLTTRLLDVNQVTGKQTLEQKIKYKQRMGAIMPSLAKSPDEMDAAALAVQSAIANFGFTPGQRREIRNSGGDGFFDQKAWVHQQNGKVVDVGSGGRLSPPVATFKSGLGEMVSRKKGLGW